LLFCVCLERSQANKILLQPGILWKKWIIYNIE
jgi:hypothetical protein